jgi:hypothetical protein
MQRKMRSASRRKAQRLLSAAAGAALFLLLHPESYGSPDGAARPIIVEGEHLQDLLGLPINTLALYRVEDGRTGPVPFQIDRRICSKRGKGETCPYILEGEPDVHASPGPPLGPDDELVFLAEDGGGCRETVPDHSVEIRIEATDAGEQTCVYLGPRDGPEPVPEPRSDVSYDPARDVVSSETYRIAFDPESPYFWKEISLKEEEGWSPLFADEGIHSQVAHAGSLVAYDIERDDFRTRLVGYRAGPIRVIRVVRNRLRIGPFVWKETLETAIFYRDQFHTTFHTGTYLHNRFLVEERQRLFTGLAPEALGWSRMSRPGAIKGLVDGRTSPEEEAVRPDGLPELVLRGEAGIVLYRLCRDPSGKPDRNPLHQAYLEEPEGSFASAGICIPNLQESNGPRHRFVKSLFFLPSAPVVKEAEAYKGEDDEVALLESCLQGTQQRGPDRRWGIVPIISAGPDKGLGAGLKFRHLGLLRPDQPLEARFQYTLFQYQIAEFWYFAQGLPFRRSGLRLTCNYYNKTRTRFYGIGNDTGESDVVGFTWQDLDLSLLLDHELPHGFGLLAGWRSRRGSVWRGKDSDLPDLEDVHPDLFGIEGGWSNGPVLGVYHSTLEPLHDPLAGGRQSFTVRLADDRLGGTYTFQRYRLEVIQVIPLPPYTHRLVLRGQAQLLGGDPPFTLLSWVGGDDTARGYFEGRYRDRDRILFNAEYRCNLYKFFDGVLFVDTGRVAKDLLQSAPFKDLHVTGGFGMRFHLYPDLLVRFDVGFSSEMIGAYLNFGHTY